MIYIYSRANIYLTIQECDIQTQLVINLRKVIAKTVSPLTKIGGFWSFWTSFTSIHLKNLFVISTCSISHLSYKCLIFLSFFNH